MLPPFHSQVFLVCGRLRKKPGSEPSSARRVCFRRVSIRRRWSGQSPNRFFANEAKRKIEERHIASPLFWCRKPGFEPSSARTAQFLRKFWGRRCSSLRSERFFDFLLEAKQMGGVEPPICFGAGNRSRTGTVLSYHGILSPGRLPIPPFRRHKL